MMNLDELEALAKAAPGGQWEVWTSNSWRRVLATDGCTTARVIEPTVQHYDNHPDLRFGDGVVDWLESVTPEVILALIAEVRTLRETPSDDAVLCALVAWFDVNHPDQEDFRARMRKAIAAARGAK
jgi:hypothetical protein